MEAGRIRESPRSSRAGFVLTGGRSARMGQDKAMLPWGNSTLVEYVAGCVRRAAGNVTLAGAPERYGHLGIAAVADRYENCGPLGGICTALAVSSAEWNLIVACDMPGVTADFLGELLEAAETSGADCVIPRASDGLHPLCAVYHGRVLQVAKRQISGKSLKMHDFLAILRDVQFPAAAASVENVNTPLDWISR